MESTLIANATVANAAAAYSSGDIIGGVTLFTKVYSPNNGSILNWVQVIDEEKKNLQFRLYLFSKALAGTYSDNGVFSTSVTVADFKNCIAKITILATDYETFNTFSGARVTKINTVSLHGVNIVYGVLVVDGTPTFAATGKLSIQLGFYAAQ